MNMVVFSGFYASKKKAYTKTINGFIPTSLVVPVRLLEGDRCIIRVQVGDTVEEGACIAASENPDTGKSLSYAPVPGTVTEIGECRCPNGTVSEGIRIQLGGTFRFLGRRLEMRDAQQRSAEDMLSEIEKQGIINTFVTDKPLTLAKSIRDARAEHPFLIVRLFDEDPSRITDSLITAHFLEEVYSGAAATATALGAAGIIFITEKEFSGQKDFEFGCPAAFVPVDERRYPAAFKKDICAAVRKALKNTPFCAASEQSLFTDSPTMQETHRAIRFGIPVIDRYVHVSGDCINASGLMKVAIGTPLSYLAEQCGGLRRSLRTAIVNGQISGFAVDNLDAPVTKYVKSVVFLSSRHIAERISTACARCGNCRRACPRHLAPDIIYRHITGEIIAENDYLRSTALCSLCGLCNSVCSARLPICQTIDRFKKEHFIRRNERQAAPAAVMQGAQ